MIGNGDLMKTEQKLKEGFKDLLRFSEDSLKEVWDNESDDVWSEYLKNENRRKT